MRILFSTLFLSFLFLNAQTDKKIDKCIKVFNKGSQDKGIKKLNALMNTEFTKYNRMPRLRSYEVLVAMEFERYNKYLGIFDPENVDVVNDDGETDSTVYQSFKELYELTEKRFSNICRRATIESTSYSADMYYRKFEIDVDPDTAITEKAEEYYKEAEEFFQKEDYELAELNYRKALNECPEYYKALLYLGDSFWAREDYDSAMVFYTQAKAAYPNLVEPRKFIIDALMEKELYFRAKKECLEAMTVFPGYDVKRKYQRILSVENKFMNDHRIYRTFYPNNITKEEQGKLSNAGAWTDYRDAKDEISRYCNDDGIIEENGKTTEKFLEVFSIKRMLEENKDDLPEHLHFAAQMEEEGYLEAYIFIGLFHVDIYPQFQEYMKDEGNREKAKEWIEKYCIESFKE